ncbi:MAG: amidohydrolase [Deltaproteobacteria bacterium]|nr:amidohydrolase [Deltaproteobacteria bacterium]
MAVQIFENGVFISCEDANRIYSVLVEDGGRIVFTGDVIPDAYRGIRNRTNMNGDCIVPAFADTHMHFDSHCLFQSTLDVRHVRNFRELTSVIQSYEHIHREENILIGFGCSAHTVEENHLPDIAILDSITSKPLMLVKYDGHAAVANSSMLKKLPAHITGDPGCNKTTGWLYQMAFYEAVKYITGSVSLYNVMKTLINGTDHLARQGIGLIHTMAGVGFPLDADVDLMRFAAKGLPLQFRIYFQTMNIPKVIRRNLTAIGGCFATALDGCLGSEDAALLEPYTHNPASRGMLVYPQPHVDAFAKRANRYGLQIALHANGDAAVNQAITAYEEALEDFPRSDHRHVVIHANLVNPSLLERAARIGVHFALQPPFLHWEEEPMHYLFRILGERARNLIPLQTMLNHGLTIAGGSDAPCTPPDPLHGIYTACNHPNPDERISVLDALRMYTSWASRLSFDDDNRGTLTPGKYADFTVLDGNPLSVAPEALKDVKVKCLYLGGMPYTMTIKKPLDLCTAILKKAISSRTGSIRPPVSCEGFKP